MEKDSEELQLVHPLWQSRIASPSSKIKHELFFPRNLIHNFWNLQFTHANCAPQVNTAPSDPLEEQGGAALIEDGW